MKNIYTLVQFALNEGIELSEWEVISSDINNDMKKANGLHFRDSGVDDKGNIYCILKWESEEHHKAFKEIMDKTFADHPEIMKEFWRVADMDTMSTTQINVL